MRKLLNLTIEAHEGYYTAYVNNVSGVVVGEGPTLEEALSDLASAVKFHQEAFFKEKPSLVELVDSMFNEGEE